jgi:hypothetical protein
MFDSFIEREDLLLRDVRLTLVIRAVRAGWHFILRRITSYRH